MTFRASCERLVADAARDGMVTASERLSRLRRYVWPHVGHLAPDVVTPRHITDLLAAAAASGISRTTLEHIRVDVSKVCAELVRDGVLDRNPATAERVRTPKVPRDRRRRTVLTDAEFVALVGAPTTPADLRCLAICSRGLGGMRPSDMAAWRWEDVDPQWGWADIPRPKTEHLSAVTGHAPRERLRLPDPVRRALREWHATNGHPVTGPVFPAPRPQLARDLRLALKRAGVLRREIFEDTGTTRRADFYSFRRAWVGALAASGLNAQTAMRLTGHTSMATHRRYEVRPILDVPKGVLPENL